MSASLVNRHDRPTMGHRNILNNQLGCGERRVPRSRSSNRLQTGQQAWTTFNGALRGELTKRCERQSLED